MPRASHTYFWIPFSSLIFEASGHQNSRKLIPKSFENWSQIDPKKLRKEFWNGLRKTQKKTFGIQLPKPCKSIKNKWFFIVFCISTLFKMMANMERNFIQNWFRIDPKSIKIPSEVDLKNDAIFECILTSIFGRFWSIWGSKMRRPGRPRRANDPSFFEFVRLGWLLGASWVSWGPRGGKDNP